MYREKALHSDIARPLLIRLVAITAVCTALLPLHTSDHAAAQTAFPPARALALPLGAFPVTAAIAGSAPNNNSADINKLHTLPADQLGRVSGYLQTAWWSPVIHSRHVPAIQLAYTGCFFQSEENALAAYGDARASLWETGHPLSSNILGTPVFQIVERDGHRDNLVLLQHGPIEAELRLRVGPRATNSTIESGLWYLWRLSKAALKRLDQLSGSIALPPAQASSPTLPPIFNAPWGTGPVVESPSLMTIDSPIVPPATSLNPGAFRPYGSPGLATLLASPSSTVPAGALARYVRTATVAGAPLYAETTLYGSPQSATTALQNLAAANTKLSSLPLDPSLWSSGNLSILDASQGWKGAGEEIVAARIQNVLLVLASTYPGQAPLAGLANGLVGLIPTWLHTGGTSVFTQTGKPVHLTGLNWYGAEQQDFVVGGLQYRSYEDILQQIKLLGYNSIRIPFSNQMVEQNPVVTAHVDANPELAGMHALDILDRIIGYAGALGISVILDDHRSEAGWSSEPSGLWYTDQYPDTAFVHDWATLAQRYAVNNVVVGADLRNEPHASAVWGGGNPATDWLAAAERAGDAVLAANPHVLIVVEGVQYYSGSPSYWWGGNLMGVATAPVVLQFADGTPAHGQLVYSAHDYGPDNCGSGCPWFNATTTPDALTQLWTEYWGYIVADPTKPYAAPVWVGEFGTCNYNVQCVTNTAPGSQGQWFSTLIQYLKTLNLGWSYWSANGTESTGGTRVYGTLDWYGYFKQDWVSPIPWLHDALSTIQDQTATNTAPSSPGQ